MSARYWVQYRNNPGNQANEPGPWIDRLGTDNKQDALDHFDYLCNIAIEHRQYKVSERTDRPIAVSDVAILSERE